MKGVLLLKLADLLEELPAKRFDYTVWVGPEWMGKEDLSCGTVACALGWATTMSPLRRMGLHLDKSGEVGIKPTPANGLSPGDIYDQVLNSPFYAAAYAFGISQDEACWLFSPYRRRIEGTDKPRGPRPGPNSSAKSVAKHIRKFVEWKRAQGKKR